MQTWEKKFDFYYLTKEPYWSQEELLKMNSLSSVTLKVSGGWITKVTILSGEQIFKIYA